MIQYLRIYQLTDTHRYTIQEIVGLSSSNAGEISDELRDYYFLHPLSYLTTYFAINITINKI